MAQIRNRVATGVICLLSIISLAGCHKNAAMPRYTGDKGDIYPADDWQQASRPEQRGWSSSKLAEARRYSRGIDTAAVMIVDDGVVVDAWGDISRNFQCHSMRKSLLSGLMGKYVADGTIDLSKTLADLGINDYGQRLTETEKQATVGDLIKARSGIYIEALGESPEMKSRRPKRHSHPPGTFWYYNNWDFNALGTIFEKATGADIFEAFEQHIARPLRMQDFDPADCQFKNSNDYGTPGLSMHRYYLFRMSARDLARFGLLFLREGRWEDRQILPQKWIRESTASHSSFGTDSGYGYMWWTGSGTGLYDNVSLRGHSYSAAGWGGHRLIVLPWRKLVIVHRVNTDQPQKSVANHQIGRLLWHILDAAGEADFGLKPTIEAAAGVRLGEDQLKAILPGCGIHGPDFKVNLTRDYRFELWSDGKQVDSGGWGIQGDKFWLKSRIVTGGHTARLSLVLDGDRLKWFDRQGTLQGQGTIKRKEK